MTSRPADSSHASAGSRVEVPLEEQIFELVYRQMRSLAAGRERDLDDLVQDAMEQALRSLPSFQGRSKLSTWTFQVCYRTLLKRRRSWMRWLKRFSFTSTGELPEPHLADGREPALQRERIARVHDALGTLGEKKRVVVTLHDLEGHSSEEIAELVGAKIGTVRSRLRDGRRELLLALRGDPFFGESPDETLEEA
jgi:RNA polymerase sigma-70 factor (ECF subfamily)